MSATVKTSQKHQPSLQRAAPPLEISAEQLHFRPALTLDFQTTKELEPLRDFTGQERARAALEIGLGVASRGFNIFVSGLRGTEKLETLRAWVAQRAVALPTPRDWVYVHNFTQPDMPKAISLAAGQGRAFKRFMSELVKSLREQLPKAFREEAFDKEKAHLKEKYTAKAHALAEKYVKLARDKGFLIQTGGGGRFILIPLAGGKPLEPEAFAKLSEEEKDALASNQEQVASELEEFTAKQQEFLRALSEDIREIERRFCKTLLTPFLGLIKRELQNTAVDEYLDEVEAYILEHLDDFKESPHAGSPTAFPFAAPPEHAPFLEYEVNVMADNADTQGAPVLVETAPTYLNLFGAIERIVDRFGRVVTNFTRIKPGALLRANGGYLIFDLEDAIVEFGVWKTLKRILKSGRIEMETYEPFALFATTGLKPEPISIQTKVVLVGSPFLYHLLYLWDNEFREIFKVHADFRPIMELDAQHLLAYGQWVAQLCREEHLPHFERAAVERLVEFGARQAEDRQKVSASYAEIADLVREAAYWTRDDKSQIVSARHVQRAIEQRMFRSNRIEEELRDLITQGTIFVDIGGSKVGQVNGLSVLQIGGYSFGRPSRVTASVGMGRTGIVNIERESRLSESLHDKGLLILAGYLRNRYGQDQPLTLSASLCFEQSYAGVEGDSASTTELYALLSRLAELPIRQDLAVTGSVNQWGEVQAIGGVNEKVEGFFDVCRAHGLTGNQGVLIPVANLRNLLLRADVIEAVAQGQFHLYPIRTVDEGIELLTGVRAGTVEEEGTVNWLVKKRLHDLAVGLKEFAPSEERSAVKKAIGNTEGAVNAFWPPRK